MTRLIRPGFFVSEKRTGIFGKKRILGILFKQRDGGGGFRRKLHTWVQLSDDMIDKRERFRLRAFAL